MLVFPWPQITRNTDLGGKKKHFNHSEEELKIKHKDSGISWDGNSRYHCPLCSFP